MTGMILQQSIAQTTTTNTPGVNTTATANATTLAETGTNATTNGTATPVSPVAVPQGQQPSAINAGQFKIEASDTRIPGSQFVMVVNSTGALRNILSNIAQQPLAGFSSQGPMLLPPPPARVGPLANDPSVLMFVDQIINDILRMRAIAPTIAPPGITGGISPVSASICYDIGWFHVCVERVS